jgi:hypothetical protein
MECNHAKVFSGEYKPLANPFTLYFWICSMCGKTGEDNELGNTNIKEFANLYLKFIEPDNKFWKKYL